ncbi:MAG: ABC-F family ATP-binding cassette domain-containing protein [Bacteroidia bacterium]|nr:ABC-F family ATP-binding cassette domain-containing protein [Bacteroidia bacterium]MDW8159308.1 ABC-F family ATP-binding cassette domain-containing protein [Bacteroidia bacterium]
MNYLSLENVSKSYGEKLLFSNISFGISKGQKFALIARNGTGKTSLLNIIAGLESPDEGVVSIRKEITVGYLAQNPILNPECTVLETLYQGDTPQLKALKAYEQALNEGNSTNIERAMELMEQWGAWDYEARARQVLSRLRIEELNQLVKNLSGGQRKRVALAQVLIANPEFLILDEPTNHLDIEMIEWLEQYLSQDCITLLLVTHDRYFLDNICQVILELEEGSLYTYYGNYEYYLEKKADREFRQARELEKNRNLYRKELEWMRRQPQARTTKAKAREDSFYELEEKVKSRRLEPNLELNVKTTRIGGKILEIKNVTKKWGNTFILKNFSYVFKPFEKVGIVGRNGVGKTTFLNLLTGAIQPDAGSIVPGETIVMGYYQQEYPPFKEGTRVIDVVKNIAEVIPLSTGEKVSAQQFLYHFQFDFAMQQSLVEKLSGGEKRRLHLLTVLMKNPNFLILDEPTNDLDLITLNLLEEFLMHYTGCLVLVSHDRYFMDKIVDHLLIFEGEGKIKDYNGNYRQYRAEKEIEEKKQSTITNTTKQKEEILQKSVKKNENRKRKLTFNEQREYEQLEKELMQLEARKEELAQIMSLGNATHQQMQEWATEMAKIIEKIEQKTERWLELAEIAENA